MQAALIGRATPKEKLPCSTSRELGSNDSEFSPDSICSLSLSLSARISLFFHPLTATRASICSFMISSRTERLTVIFFSLFSTHNPSRYSHHRLSPALVHLCKPSHFDRKKKISPPEQANVTRSRDQYTAHARAAKYRVTPRRACAPRIGR